MIDRRRKRLVYEAIERDSFSPDADTARRADAAMVAFLAGEIAESEWAYYLVREIEWRELSQR